MRLPPRRPRSYRRRTLRPPGTQVLRGLDRLPLRDPQVFQSTTGKSEATLGLDIMLFLVLPCMCLYLYMPQVAQIQLLLSLPVPQSCRLVKALLLRIVMSGMYGERRFVALHLGQGIRSLRSTYSCLLLQTTTWDHPQQLLGVYHRQQNLRHSSALLTT